MTRRSVSTNERPIGFSTGSLAKGDFNAALESLRCSDATAVELSALRENELLPLMQAIPTLNLARFAHVSVHAPSALRAMDETALGDVLRPALTARLPVVVHADILRDFPVWRSFGKLLLIENMDKRKSSGRTASELRPILDALPKAKLCLDLAHARQIDSSLCETVTLLEEFGPRIAQLHISELDAQSRHESLSHAAVAALRSVSRLIPVDAPVILEFSASPETLNAHIRLVRSALRAAPILARSAG